MFLHYLKIALRNLKNKWGFNLTSMLALIMGTILFAMIFYVTDHDRFFKTSESFESRSYRALIVHTGVFDNGEIARTDTTVVYESFWLENPELFEDPDIEFVVGTFGENYQMIGSRTARLYLTDAHNRVSEISERALNVSPAFFRFKGMSLLYGDRLPEHPNEVVVTESFIRKHSLGTDLSNISLTMVPAENQDMSVLYSVSLIGTEPLYIVNVIKDDKWSRNVEAEIYFNCIKYDNVTVVLREGADVDKVNARLSLNKIEKVDLEPYQFYNGVPYSKHIRSLYLRNDSLSRMPKIWQHLLSVILLLTGAVCFLSSLTNSFFNQKQNNRIRLSLGAGKGGLFWGQMMQVIVMIAPVMAISAILTIYVVGFVNHTGLYPHYLYSAQVDRVYFHLPDVIILEVQVLLFVTLLSALILAAIVLFNKPATSLNPGLTRRERHVLRNMLIGLEVSVAVCACFCTLGYLSGRQRLYNPLSRSELKRTYMVDLSNPKFDQFREVLANRICNLPMIEDAVMTGSPQIIQYDDWNLLVVSLNTIGAEGNNMQYVIISDSNYFRFFKIPVEYHDAVPGENKVYLSETMYDYILSTGNQPEPFYQLSEKKLEEKAMQGLLPESENIEDYYPVFERFTVAGVFKNRFGDLSDPIDNNRYILLSDEDSPCKCLYIRFKTGTDFAEARHEIDALCAEYVDIYSPEMISQIGNKWLDSSGNTRIYMILVFMAAAAGLFMVVLSITSAISTDTGRRRKEVALRKVHGAKAVDIARLFVRPYIIILIVAFAAGWYIATLIRHSVGSFMWIRIRPWHSAIVLFFIAFVMTLSTFWKVRRIMRTNPADVVKTE
ncbi:MAG: FtsX-like permease family protein [Bacteroidaceae bacterium]|nr:FtsX-like permease family protein [Bacteroidaceae bacterium]